MSTRMLRPFGTVTLADGSGTVTLQASEGRVGLDALRVPYATADVTVPLVSVELVEQIDPRDEQRVVVTGGDEVAGASRVFDLGIRARTVDHKGRTITLSLASDEAMLQDYAPLADDGAPYELTGSLRSIVDYVLGTVIPGAGLEASSTDADMTPYWSATNLVANPCAAATADGWEVGPAGYGTLTRVTGVSGATRSTAFRATWTAGTGYWDIRSEFVPVTAGKRYYFSADVRASSARALQFRAEFYEDDKQVRATYVEQTVGSTWSLRQGVFADAPPRANKARVFVRNVASGSSGQWIEATAMMLVESTVVMPYFDGVSTGGGYTYEFSGDADSSASTRTPIVDRSPELFWWRSGVTAWDFLQPLTTAAGLRLFCDESRVWRLINPELYSRAGRLTLGPWNAAEGDDEISRDDAYIFCTGVVVNYAWEDDNGISQRATDAAGTPSRVYVVDLDRPYPGPGAAAAMLTARAGKGRVQDVTALAEWGTVPAQEVGISLPGSDLQVGVVRGVEWGLTDGRMRVTARGVADATPDVWLGWDPAEDWTDADVEWEDA